MNNRKVKVYIHAWTGDGCFEHFIDVNDNNFISETENTITIKEKEYDRYDDEYYSNNEYCKNIDLFIEREKKWFDEHIKELTERHKHTLEMAKKLAVNE